jgi:release factor glutamine methyltransferase
MNISAAIASAAEILREVGIAEFRREASSLLAFVLQKDFVFLVANPEYEMTECVTTEFEKLLKRRAGREPLQYITGHQEFFGLDFEVCPDVLIPRPETEILVETAIEILSKRESAGLCEIGVGSGCISISILDNIKSTRAAGVDISSAALAVAARNAEKHYVADRLALTEADVFEGLNGMFDLIVSNPPYIPDDQLKTLQAEVRQYEPQTALSGGSDGLTIIKRIINNAPRFLNPNCFLLLEIGYDQGERVKKLFDMTRWESVKFLSDLQGIPRIVKARSWE